MDARSVVAAMAAALVVVACGDDEPPDVDLPEPTAACDEAFAASAAAGQAEDEPGQVTVAGLNDTLAQCQGFDDWLAGARAHPEAVPANMDPSAALDVLCENDEQAPPCADRITEDE